MRWLALLVVVAGCASEEPWPLRPPGGGGGGSGTGGGGDPVDAGVDGGGGTSLTGEVCVVLDFEAPFACPAIAQRADVLVQVAGGLSTTSGSDGTFTVGGVGAVETLRVGGADADGLVTTLSQARLVDAPVEVPAVDEVAFDEVLNALVETLSTGAIVAYVVNSSGAPLPGAAVTEPPGSRLYYDDGTGGWDGQALTTGPDGIALILDTASTTLEATVGARIGAASFSTEIGAIGVGVITVPD